MAKPKPPDDDNTAFLSRLKEVCRGHPALFRKWRRSFLQDKQVRGKCDKCAEKATVEVETIKQRTGKSTIQRYCLECAAKAGMAVKARALRAARRERLQRDRQANKSHKKSN